MEEPGINGIILYQSKYGASPKYAQWLSEKTGFPCVETKRAKISDVPCFYCRGAWDTEALRIVDRNLCNLLRKGVAKKDSKDYEVWEQALMAAGDDKCDWTDQKYIEPIPAALKE